jgi:hypothetical protein|tara:strand:+ start:1679 stop:2050 length:372 start_codon:yes stop_codon:yes gene_type:complete
MALAYPVSPEVHSNSAVVYQQNNLAGCSYIVIISTDNGTCHVNLLGTGIWLDDRGIPPTERDQISMNEAALELECVVHDNRIKPRDLQFNDADPLKDWYHTLGSIEHRLESATILDPGSPSTH